ncbi:MAG: hypothetical protein AAGF35_14595, partial [Pseudomonadota bacterium]
CIADAANARNKNGTDHLTEKLIMLDTPSGVARFVISIAVIMASDIGITISQNNRHSLIIGACQRVFAAIGSSPNSQNSQRFHY